EAYTKAIRLQPSMQEAYFNRALTHSELGQDKEAVRDMDTLVSSGSELGKKLKGLFGAIVGANISMGTAAAERGDWNLALEKYDIALIYEPKSPDAHVGRGLIFAQRGKFDDAIAEFDRALDLNPKSALAYHNRGQANLTRSRFEL